MDGAKFETALTNVEPDGRSGKSNFDYGRQKVGVNLAFMTPSLSAATQLQLIWFGWDAQYAGTFGMSRNLPC